MNLRVKLPAFLLTAVFALSGLFVAAAPSDPASAALTYFKARYEAEYVAGNQKADLWTRLIAAAAGKTDDPDFAFLSPAAADTAFEANLSVSDRAKNIMTLVALGEDPANFGGKNQAAELIAKQRPDGSFGDDVLSTAMALLALRCAGHFDFDADKAVEAVVRAKKPDGGYNDYGDGSSADTTAFVLMALTAAGTAEARREAEALIAFFRKIQGDDGFFVGTDAYAAPNACTQGMVMLALATAGEDLRAAAWAPKGVSPEDALRTLQSPDGGFWYSADAKAGKDPYFTEPDLYSTYQALLGLLAATEGSPVSALFAALPETTPDSSEPAGPSGKPANPPTGDDFNKGYIVLMIVALLLVAGAALVPVLRNRKK